MIWVPTEIATVYIDVDFNLVYQDYYLEKLQEETLQSGTSPIPDIIKYSKKLCLHQTS